MTHTTLDPHTLLTSLHMNFQGVILPRPDFYIPIREAAEGDKTPYSRNNSSSTLDGKQQAFADIKARIADLSQWEDEEEDFVYSPSEHALTLLTKIVKIAYLLSGGDLIRPLIGADGQGGLKFDWRGENKEIRLFIPATDTRTPYLYFRGDDEDGVINNPDASALAEWLAWLNN